MTDKRLDPNHSEYKNCTKIAPKKLQTIVPIAAMWQKPQNPSVRVSELLYGENAIAYAEQNEFYLLQSMHDKYVSYSKKSDFIEVKEFAQNKNYIHVKAAPLFSEADIKSPILTQLSGGSKLPHTYDDSPYQTVQVQLHKKLQTAYIHKAHINVQKNLPLNADSLIAQAEKYLGAPYIWGGRSFRGLDCSGLVQQTLMAFGITCPRDSDMQASSIGKLVETPAKGDIIFWKGHVGFFTGTHLLHAYGDTCLVQKDKCEYIFPRLTIAVNASICARSLT